MSFPSAVEKLEAGWTAEDALWHAMQHDTEMGFVAISALVKAVRDEYNDPIGFVQGHLVRFGTNVVSAVLRSEQRGLGVCIDFDPLSKLGMQVARLMGTDAARPLMTERLGMSFGFANCCKVIASTDEGDVRFTPLDQIKWQANIDC